MRPIVMPEGVHVALSKRDMELLSEALMVRIKTLRATLKKGVKEDYIREELRSTEHDAYWLLMHFADLQWIERKDVDAQLEKNPYMTKAST